MKNRACRFARRNGEIATRYTRLPAPRQGCRRIAAALALSLAVSLPSPGQADALRGTREYKSCMHLARVSPEEGFEAALSWGDQGGGPAAKHCAAVALFSMGQYAEAAARFETLATGLAAEPPTRSRLLAQAGQAWLLDGDVERAYAVQSAAIELTPAEPELRIDRAMVLAERGRYREAVEDLNTAIDNDPGLVSALVLRASARRYLDELDLARRDVDRALELAPQHPEALLESGIIHRLRGENEAARQDWLTLSRSYEGTPAADAAQRNLEKLDLKVE